jgi:PAS domain S-box-containing protein
LLPPVGRFWLSDPRDVLVLAAFLVIGITTSRLSDRARTEALNANQRRAEAVAAQQRFVDLVNSVEGIVWEADAQALAFSFVSEQAERILGYPVEQWLREPTFWKDHLHPEDGDRVAQFCAQITAEKRTHDFEYRMIGADGRVVWLRNLVTVLAENGRATQLRGVMIDITDRKQNEETLREQANLLSLTHDAIFVRDANATIKYWNRAAEEMYGWTAEEACGKVSHGLLKTAFLVPIERIEAELRRAGRWEGELVHTGKDGTSRVVASRWSLQRNNQGTAIAILEINNDITEQKRAEQARHEIEQQWRAAFESNPTMYFILDAAGTIVSVNAFGAEQLGYTVSELVGQRVLNVFYEPDRQVVQGHANASFEQPGRTTRWEARKIHKHGSMLWVRETANAVVLKNRPVLLVVCEDITEQKHAEESLRRSEAYLAESQRLTKTGSWAYNPFAGETIYWSDEMLRIFGLDPQAGPSSEQFWQLVHPEDRERVKARVEREAHDKKPSSNASCCM